MNRREMIKRLLILAAVPAVAKVFPPGTALAAATESPEAAPAGIPVASVSTGS